MALFSNHDTLALEVGRLSAKLDQIEQRIATLEQRKPEAPVPVQAPLPEDLLRLVGALAHGDAALYRHLDGEARAMLGAGLDVRAVQRALYTGSR